MENYRKQDTKSSPPEFIPKCVQIQQGGKIRNYVSASQKLLDQGPMTIVGNDIAINKAVTVLEILKRNNKLIVDIQLFSTTEKDEWVSVDPTLANVIVTKNIPGIRINIEKSAIQ